MYLNNNMHGYIDPDPLKGKYFILVHFENSIFTKRLKQNRSFEMNQSGFFKLKKYIFCFLFFFCSVIAANAQHQKHLGLSLGYNYAVPNSGEEFSKFHVKYSFTGILFSSINSNCFGTGLDVTSFNRILRHYLISGDYLESETYYNVLSPYILYGFCFSIEKFNIVPVINAGCAVHKAWHYDKRQLSFFLKPEVLLGYHFGNKIRLYVNFSYDLLFQNFGIYVNSNIEEPEPDPDVTQYYALGLRIAYSLNSKTE